jgi:hypothetical protein
MDTLSCCKDCFERYNTAYSARHNHINCLKYLHKNGCCLEYWTTVVAAFAGHIEILKYLHTIGCPWNYCTIKAATIHGNLNCLKYAYENGCPLYPLLNNMDTTKEASVNCHRIFVSQKNYLKYIHLNCQSFISHADKELLSQYINQWKELVDVALDDKRIPLDIKNIIYTLW